MWREAEETDFDMFPSSGRKKEAGGVPLSFYTKMQDVSFSKAKISMY